MGVYDSSAFQKPAVGAGNRRNEFLSAFPASFCLSISQILKRRERGERRGVTPCFTFSCSRSSAFSASSAFLFFFPVIIHDPLNPVLEKHLVEVDQQSHLKIQQPQMGCDLRLVHGV